MSAQRIPAGEGGHPVRDTFLVFGAPRFEEAEIQEVVSSLRSGWVGTGPKTLRFEEQFRAYTGRRYAIGVNSCTAGLHLAMLALGIRDGDEVITSPMTFCASANAIIHAGGRPVFADCQKDMTIDPAAIERKITPRTRAILPVHMAGRSCDMPRIMALARQHRLWVIEDCAHAIEAEFHGQKAGTWGDAACYSFYVTKNVVTGEGGMVTTDDPAIEQRVRVLALHGMSRDAWKRFSDSGYRHYEITDAGFKYNMTDIQASLGLHQLSRVQENWKRRAAIWDRYNTAFADLPCQRPSEIDPKSRHAYHLYTLLIDPARLRVTRDQILDAFVKERIGVGVHYVSLHTHGFYQQYIPAGDTYPVAQAISDRTVSLPLSPSLSDRDVEDVIEATRKILKYYEKPS